MQYRVIVILIMNTPLYYDDRDRELGLVLSLCIETTKIVNTGLKNSIIKSYSRLFSIFSFYSINPKTLRQIELFF